MMARWAPFSKLCSGSYPRVTVYSCSMLLGIVRSSLLQFARLAGPTGPLVLRLLIPLRHTRCQSSPLLLQAVHIRNFCWGSMTEGSRKADKMEKEVSECRPAEDFLPLSGSEQRDSVKMGEEAPMAAESATEEMGEEEKTVYPPTEDFLPLFGEPSSPAARDVSPAARDVSPDRSHDKSPHPHDASTWLHPHPHDNSPVARDASTQLQDKSPQSCDMSPDAHGQSSLPRDASPAADASHEKFTYFSKGFTSEVFKIRLQNFPGRMGYNNLRKYLTSLDLAPVKIKKPSHDSAFITFRNEEDRMLGLKTLDGRVWKNRTLKAKVANPTPDPLFRRKRPRPEDEAAMEAKKARIQNMTLEERLQDAVTPWLKFPYPEQLQKKEEELRGILKNMAYGITHKDSHPGKWFEQYISQHNGMVCPLKPIRHSPSLEGYRNKCEFAIGRCPSSEARVVVGFRLGSYEEGSFEVASVASCCHISKRTKELAGLFEVFFNQSALEPFSSKNEQGYWRMVSVRSYQSGETMAVVQLHPQQLSQGDIAEQKAKLTEFFTVGDGSWAPPTSLYFQVQGRLEANVEPSYEHLLGSKCVHENLLGLKFRISPASFFQVNTSGAELLYSLIRDLAVSEGVKNPVIYDICCGTGTIGLYLAKGLAEGSNACKVVGVEMVEQAVKDARVNAELNGVSNVAFVCGKAEDVMPTIDLPWARKGGIIGIVDPPRGGLHPKVTRIIRECPAIQRLIYVSCNPGGAKKNIVDLCRRKSNRIKGQPFHVVSATPVDMFPHTPHCELVMLLERVSEERVPRGGREGVKEVGPERVKGPVAGVEGVKEELGSSVERAKEKTVSGSEAVKEPVGHSSDREESVKEDLAAEYSVENKMVLATDMVQEGMEN